MKTQAANLLVGVITSAALVVGMTYPALVDAVELSGLAGYERLFGRYAPGGDCAKQPRIVVDERGLAFEVDGKTVLVTDPEHAVSFAGPEYEGKSVFMFPFRLPDGYSILMTFDADEVDGRLVIAPQDEGWPGGPKLTPRNEALVKGSPYQRCK
jgi:hypothetical protein